MAKLNNQDIMVSMGWRAQLYRETIQRPDFFELVTNYTMLGAMEEQLAAFFDTDRETWLYWMKHSAPLRQAVANGTHIADAKVAAAMHKRATGYEYVRQKVVIDKQGHGEVIDLIEHVPPDTSAGKFWLVNRHDNWSDKTEHQHGGQVEVDKHITIEFVSPRDVIDITPVEDAANDDDDDVDRPTVDQ